MATGGREEQSWWWYHCLPQYCNKGNWQTVFSGVDLDCRGRNKAKPGENYEAPGLKRRCSTLLRVVAPTSPYSSSSREVNGTLFFLLLLLLQKTERTAAGQDPKSSPPIPFFFLPSCAVTREVALP